MTRPTDFDDVPFRMTPTEADTAASVQPASDDSAANLSEGTPTPTRAGIPITPTAALMFSHPWHLIAQGFGSGLSPIMPGTMGTLFAWLTFHVFSTRWPLFFTEAHWGWIIVVGFFIGIVACERTGRALGAADHGSMVWDEIIAFWLVLLLITPADFSTQCWAFFWFRLFDMTKPPPIAYFDRHIKGGFGVMWDDIVAAFYAVLVFALWRVVM